VASFVKLFLTSEALNCIAFARFTIAYSDVSVPSVVEEEPAVQYQFPPLLIISMMKLKDSKVRAGARFPVKHVCSCEQCGTVSGSNGLATCLGSILGALIAGQICALFQVWIAVLVASTVLGFGLRAWHPHGASCRHILTQDLGYVLLHSPLAGKTGMDVQAGTERVKRPVARNG
jgi:hypothetical protein